MSKSAEGKMWESKVSENVPIFFYLGNLKNDGASAQKPLFIFLDI